MFSEKFWKRLAICFVALVFASTLMDLHSFYDRRRLNALVEARQKIGAFDREARLARERLEDPARAERAAAEGWPVPTDQAGTNTDRWG